MIKLQTVLFMAVCKFKLFLNIEIMWWVILQLRARDLNNLGRTVRHKGKLVGVEDMEKTAEKLGKNEGIKERKGMIER